MDRHIRCQLTGNPLYAGRLWTFLHWCRDKTPQSCSSWVEGKVTERSSSAGRLCDVLSCEILHWWCVSNEVRTVPVLCLLDLWIGS